MQYIFTCDISFICMQYIFTYDVFFICVQYIIINMTFTLAKSQKSEFDVTVQKVLIFQVFKAVANYSFSLFSAHKRLANRFMSMLRDFKFLEIYLK